MLKYEYHEEEKDGMVLESSPKSLAKVKSGSSVKLVVNSYEGTIEVKDYKGSKLDLVTAELEKDGIRVVATPKKVTKEDKKQENKHYLIVKDI